MEPILEIKNLVKTYGKKEAVRGLDLAVPAGELFSFVGPNGAGKTSTLKMMVGLLKPTSGTVRIGGFDFSEKPEEAKRLISFVPDTPFVYEKLTPRELLRFVGKLYDLDRETIQTRSQEFLRFFSLSQVQDILIEEFSHGMRQKAILAAALLHEPKVLILDEPMVGLDPIMVKNFKDLLKKMSQEGMTIIFSTHTLAMAEELADRIGIINHGRWVGLGTIEELRRRYQSQENLEYMFLKLVEKEEAR